MKKATLIMIICAFIPTQAMSQDITQPSIFDVIEARTAALEYAPTLAEDGPLRNRLEIYRSQLDRFLHDGIEGFRISALENCREWERFDRVIIFNRDANLITNDQFNQFRLKFDIEIDACTHGTVNNKTLVYEVYESLLSMYRIVDNTSFEELRQCNRVDFCRLRQDA